MSAKLTDGQAQAAIDTILAAIKKAATMDDLVWLAAALQQLPVKLTDAQAQTAIEKQLGPEVVARPPVRPN